MPRKRKYEPPPPANANDPVVDSTTLRRVSYLRGHGRLKLTFTTDKV